MKSLLQKVIQYLRTLLFCLRGKHRLKESILDGMFCQDCHLYTAPQSGELK